jgi:hypothetical protein
VKGASASHDEADPRDVSGEAGGPDPQGANGEAGGAGVPGDAGAARSASPRSAMPRSDAPRVLAIADVAVSYVAAWRVHGPLAALKRRGLVSGYLVTDATLRGLPARGRFDVVWLQRAVDPFVTQRLVSALGGRFLLDVDDHLLCRPGYLQDFEFPRPEGIAEALRAARVVTVPSQRLAGLLAARAGADLAAKAIVCPNAARFAGLVPREPQRPEAVVFTQGHRLALTESAEEVLTAIAEVAGRHALPICSFGPALSGPAGRDLILNGVVESGQLSLTDYHRVLADLPPMLAVAPLETRGDAATVEFVAGKSDVKMVDYGGLGHPGVYSAAAPYAESDLRCGRLAANTYDAWTAAMEQVLADGWRSARDEQLTVAARRDIDAIAETCWGPAIAAARLESPVEVRELFGLLDVAEARARNASARAHWHLRRRRGA